MMRWRKKEKRSLGPQNDSWSDGEETTEERDGV